MWLLSVLLVLLPCLVWGANTHATPDQAKEMQAWFGDALAGYAVSGCLPGTSGTATTGTFACNAYVKASGTELVYVTQPTKTVGALPSTNGTYWIAVHRDISTAVSDWTRQAGTHYIWKTAASATQPSNPTNGLVIAGATISGCPGSCAVSAVTDARLPRSYVLRGMYDITDPLYGAVGDDSTNNVAAITAAQNSLPSTGGILFIPEGIYRFGSQVTFTKPVRIVTAGREATTLKASTTGYPLFTTSRSLEIRGATFVRTDAAVNTSHAAIRLTDAPTANTRVYIDDVKITGFDIGVYTESASGRANLEAVIVKHCTITTNTLNTGSVTPTLNLNNALSVEVGHCTLNQPLTSQDNNTYFFTPQHFYFHDNTVFQGVGVKLDTNPTDGIDTARIFNNTFTSASLAIETLTDGSAIRVLQIENNLFESGRVLDNTTGEIFISNNPTTPPSPVDYDLISIKNNFFRNTDKRPIIFSVGAGHTIGTVHLMGNLYYNWSAGSPGTYFAVQKGGSGTYRDLFIDNETANGNGNGKAYWNLGFSNETIGIIFETAVTVPTTTPNNSLAYFDRIRVRNGIQESGGLKHQRVSTGSVSGGGARADVVLTWANAFADANYSVVVSVVDTTGAGAAMRIERIRAKDAGSITVQVINDAGGAITGTIEAIAMHD